MDRIEANKAFKEVPTNGSISLCHKCLCCHAPSQAVQLEQLKHPYICSHRDVFVVWDKEVRSAHVYFLIRKQN